MLYKREYYFLIFIFIIALVVFFPTFSNDFQKKWDDSWILLENPFVTDITLENLNYHLTHFYSGQYSPVNTMIYAIVYHLFGFNAMAFHTTCLLMHSMNSILVYLVFKNLLNVLNPKFAKKNIRIYTFVVALVFAIHPLQVESVAWISASKILLYSFFVLLSIHCYVLYIKTSKIGYYIGVLVFYAIGFGSKEQAIVLPAVLLLLDYAYNRFEDLSSFHDLLNKKVILDKTPLFLMAFFFWYFSSANHTGQVTIENTYPLYQRLFFGMHSMSEYIFRSIAPVKLYYYYFFPMNIGDPLPWYYWGYMVITLIVFGFIWKQYKKKNKLVLFGFLFFMVNIVLVLHILPMPRQTITADRYMYLGIIGLAIILVWFLDHVYNNFKKIKEIIDKRKIAGKPLLDNPIVNE
jgi:hypothetical protein